MKAIFRLFRTLGYLFTGRIDRISSVWQRNPDVISATYDRVVEEKRKRLNQYKDAVGGMIVTDEKKKITLKNLTEETTKLERLKSGALAKAKQVAARYNDPDLIKNDPEYIKCQAAFRDFSSTLEEKTKHIQELEVEIENNQHNLSGHKSQIESLMRDLEKIKNEKHEVIADVVSAEEERKIADMFSGISEDKTSQELSELREMRTKAKAGARMSRELAGLDNKKSEEDFLAYAENNIADNEFDKLIGITKENTESVKLSETKLDE